MKLQIKAQNPQSDHSNSEFAPSRAHQHNDIPASVHEVLQSPGQPLEPETRGFMESRFRHDFSQVRVHTGAKAAESARAVNALAYTIGNHIVFDHGKYEPHASESRRLLAHELTHTLQRPGHSISGVLRIEEHPQREAEAEMSSQAILSRPVPNMTPASLSTGIQRKVAVNNPTGVPTGAPATETNAKIARDYVSTLCPDFTVTGRDVVPTNSSACATPSTSNPTSCGCFCFMHTLTDSSGAPITWTIDINDREWPHTDPATMTVTVHSPFSGMQFGAWAKDPPTHRMNQPNWLALGHELCGHAQLFAKGTHPTGPAPTHGGRPSHDVTVQVENAVSAEHGTPATELRGSFADPHHGESFARITIAQFPLNSAHLSALPAAEVKKIDIAETFIKRSAVKIDIVGHADQQGESGFNDVLSRRRAERVKTELRGRRIDAVRFLATRGVGSSECATAGDQPSCRKVEIFLFNMEGASLTHP